MAEQLVTLRITADPSGLVSGIALAKKETQSFGTVGQEAGQRVESGMGAARRGVQSISQSLSSAKDQVFGFAKAYAGLQSVRALAGLADSWSDMTSRIRVNIGANEDANAVMDRLPKVARTTYSSLEVTADSFARNSVTLRALGKSTSDQLDYTEALNNALVVSGAKGERFESVQNALSKAMATGSLRGIELNTVLSNGTRVAEVLAAELGTNVIGLRAMGESGKITGDVIYSALVKNMQTLRGEAEAMPATIGDAFTLLRNSVLQAVGAFDQQNKLSESLAGSLIVVADSMVTVITVAAKIAVVVVAAHVAAAAAAVLHAAAQRRVAASALAEAEAHAVQARAMALVGGSASALTQAELRLAAAKAAATAAGVSQMGMLSRMGSGLLALAGGPIGIAAAALVLLAMNLNRVRSNALEVVDAAKQAGAALAAFAQSPSQITFKAVLEIDLAETYTRLVKARDDLKLKMAAANQNSLGYASNWFGVKAEDEKALRKVEVAITDLDSQLGSAAHAAANAALEATGLRSVLPGLAAAAGASAADIAKLNQSLDEQAIKLQAQIIGLQLGARAQAEYTARQELGLKATDTLPASTQAAIDKLLDLDTTYQRLKSAQDAAHKSQEDYRREQANAAKAAADYIANLEKQVAIYGQTGAALGRYEVSQLKASEADKARALDLLDVLDALDELKRETDEHAKGLDALAGINASLADKLADMRAKLGGADAAQIAFNATLRQARVAYLAAGAAANPAAVEAYAEAIRNALAELSDTRAIEAAAKQAADLESILSRFDDLGFGDLVSEIGKVTDALDKATDPEKIERLQRALSGLKHSMVIGIVDSSTAALRSMQSMTADGSRAFQAMQIAIDALTVVQAISAVLNQGQGDPYTAFARMAAMAAAVASLGVSIGNFGGAGRPSASSAEARQATQGTGTVLGDATAKSESIAKAIEITANATQQLVGLNRGMLSALQALQSALGAAGNQLARGAGNVSFPSVGGGGFNLDPFGGDPVTGAISSFLFGGSKKVIDQGIVIAGGALNDMLHDIVVGAYQTIETDGGLFGSDSTSDQMSAVSDQFGRQFQLVIGSIVDTVRAGALALGLLPADVEAAIAAFRVEEIRISLKDLSADEQQAELEAVFSSIFDDLAGSVVPFIAQFQAVGEGLGETLVRIATEVMVAQEAFKQLGLAVDETDPEKFAQISDSLIQAAGGLDAFISGMNAFVEAFVPESHKFAVGADALTSALSQAGLALPATRDGMWDLMQSLDATTEEGRKQIATLLRLAGAADAYYTALDKQTSEATQLLDSMGLLTSGLSDFGRSLVSIKAQESSAIDAANTLAKAQGRTGASSIQLAKIHEWTAKQIAAAIRQLQAETRDLIAKLYGGIPGTLDAINARISELERGTDGWGAGIDRVTSASDTLFQSWAQGVQTVQQYLDSMLLGDLSGLSPEQQLDEARRQLIAMQQAAAGGDAGALAQLPQLADAFLRLTRGSTASGADFNAQFDWVRQLLQSVVDMPNPGVAPAADIGAGASGPSVSAELQALYAERDARLAEQEGEYRAQLAQQLAQHLGDMADALNVPILALIEAQGLSLTTLAADLGVDLQNLNAASVEALGNMATTLGASMTELTQGLGITLMDLAGGLTELTERVGIDLGNLTVESTQSLAALASSLGMNLAELSTAVGVDLGSLADAQSLLNQSLAAQINALPVDQAAALSPLLQAITDATSEADANTAIHALEDAVNAMGGNTANALAPYLSGVLPVRALNQLDFLSQIHDIASDQLGVLGLIRDNLHAANSAAGIPSYAVGTGYVPNDGLAMIHQGEAIIPAPFASWMRSNGLPVGRAAANDDGALRAEVRALRDEIAGMRRDNNAGHARTATTVDSGDKAAKQQRDEIARRNPQLNRSTFG